MALLSIEQLHRLNFVRKEKNVSFLIVVQENKDGSYKASTEVGHLADIILKAENGTIKAEKNRYKLENIENETISIF
jgi:hypothetical protein